MNGLPPAKRSTTASPARPPTKSIRLRLAALVRGHWHIENRLHWVRNVTYSAILIIAPILLPIGLQVGVDPIHLGVIMIMNLEIGMVTPPLGLNLFVASGLSGLSVPQVAKAAIPSTLALVNYLPFISLPARAADNGIPAVSR